MLVAEFIAAQWYISDTEYYNPAVAWCKKKGCNLAITKAQFYDAMIQVSERAEPIKQPALPPACMIIT